MRIQEAAYEVLKELGKPVSSKEIALIALERGMVTSNAQDPVESHAQTIDKNIRGGIYNNPKLIFIHRSEGRLIGLPEWDSLRFPPLNGKKSNLAELRIRIPVELFEKIRLAEQAKLEKDFDETISLILTEGLSSIAAEIKKGLMAQLDKLN